MGRRGGITATAKQLKPERNQVESEPRSYYMHQTLVLRILEFDNLPGLDVDQVVVMTMLGRFVSGAAPAEIPPLKDTLLLKQADRAIDRGDRDMRIKRSRSAIQLLDIRVITCLGQDAGNHTALARHFQAPLDA
jgi:hypothetical protein